MRILKIHAALLLVIILLSSCASSYKQIIPSCINYNNDVIENGIEMAFKYDVLMETGNKKYAKKEFKNDISLVVLKITNHTDSAIILGQNVALLSGNQIAELVDPVIVKKLLQQSILSYLPYLLLTPLRFEFQVNQISARLNFGFLLGLGLTGGNILVANAANKGFQRNLDAYDLRNKIIPVGDTVYGIVGIRGRGFAPLSIKKTR